MAVLTFLAYLGRWQLSTPILAVVVGLVAGWEGAVLANLIGGAIFFHVDRHIFARRAQSQIIGQKVGIAVEMPSSVGNGQ